MFRRSGSTQGRLKSDVAAAIRLRPLVLELGSQGSSCRINPRLCRGHVVWNHVSSLSWESAVPNTEINGLVRKESPGPSLVWGSLALVLTVRCGKPGFGPLAVVSGGCLPSLQS